MWDPQAITIFYAARSLPTRPPNAMRRDLPWAPFEEQKKFSKSMGAVFEDPTMSESQHQKLSGDGNSIVSLWEK